MSTDKPAPLDLLAEIGQEMGRQDNRGTTFPIYAVWQEERVYGVDGDWYEIEGWVEYDADGDMRDIEMSSDGFVPSDPEDEEPVGNRVYPYAVEKVAVDGAIALTMRAAEQYIARHSHDLRGPFVRVGSMHAVPEMRAVYEALVALGRAKDAQMMQELDGVRPPLNQSDSPV